MSRRAILTVLAAALLVGAAVTPASAAAKGTISIGGNVGVGIYSMSAFNDSLAQADLEEMGSGMEFGGSVRYQVSEKAALDLEASMIKPKSTNPMPPDPDVVYSAPALAIPLSLIYTLSENDKYRFNLVVGAGMLTGAKLRGEQGATEVESSSESAVFGQAGVETAWMLAPKFALTARAIGRLAGKPEPSLAGTSFPLDYTGVVFGLGARVFFGGAQ